MNKHAHGGARLNTCGRVAPHWQTSTSRCVNKARRQGVATTRCDKTEQRTLGCTTKSSFAPPMERSSRISQPAQVHQTSLTSNLHWASTVTIRNGEAGSSGQKSTGMIGQKSGPNRPHKAWVRRTSGATGTILCYNSARRCPKPAVLRQADRLRTSYICATVKGSAGAASRESTKW